MANLLIKYHSPVLSLTVDGTLPLHYLVRKAPQEKEKIESVISLLTLMLSRGVSVNARTHQGLTAIFKVANYDIFNFLVDRGAQCNVTNMCVVLKIKKRKQKESNVR